MAAEEHGGVEGVEWLRRAPEVDAASAPSSSRWSSRERCRRAPCISKVNELKARVKELEGELYPLKKKFKAEVETEVAGQVRRVHSELTQAKLSLEHESAFARDAVRRRMKINKIAREQAVENDQLLSKVAALSSSYASLMGKHASSEKKSMADTRRSAQRERQLRADLARMNTKINQAELRRDEAEELAGEALEAEQEADDRAAAAEQRVLEAEAIADEAIAESKAASEDAAVARREVTSATPTSNPQPSSQPRSPSPDPDALDAVAPTAAANAT